MSKQIKMCLSEFQKERDLVYYLEGLSGFSTRAEIKKDVVVIYPSQEIIDMKGINSTNVPVYISVLRKEDFGFGKRFLFKYPDSLMNWTEIQSHFEFHLSPEEILLIPVF